jgi:eukaryotic-like serine/threonine-protein kinase
VSPDNVLVGVDGVARLADFGVAKARGRVRTTPAGQVKGKLAYMPAEQIRGQGVDRRADVYGAGAVLWETLAGRMLFDGTSEGEVIHRVLNESLAAPSELNEEVPPELDAIVLRALSRDPVERYATAREMANALERAIRVASQSEVADWLQHVAGAGLAQRAAQLRTMVDVGAAPDGPPTRVTPNARALSSTRRTREQGATPLPVTPPRGGARWLGVLLLAALLAGGYFWLHRAPPAAPAPAAPVVTTPEPAPAPPPPVELPLAKPVQAPAPPPAKERRRRAQKASRKAAEVDCSPPYYLDTDGIRHVKTECLEVR